MATGRNTDSKIAALPAKANQYEVPDFGQGSAVGLGIRVSPRGKKAWTFRYRDAAGKQKRVSLGTYPSTGLAGARKRAVELLELHESGTDPKEYLTAKKAEAERDADLTLSALFTDYLGLARVGAHRPSGQPKRKSTLDLEEYHWNRFIAPEFGTRPLKSITSKDIRRFIARLQAEGHTSAARQCHALLRPLFKMARREEYIDANPMDIVDAPPKPKPRERVLTPIEIKQVWSALTLIADGRAAEVAGADDGAVLHLSPSTALCLQLALVTAQRDGEVAGLHADELALEGHYPIWTIPGERTKNRRTHAVPLSPLSALIIQRAFNLPRAANALTPSEMQRDSGLQGAQTAANTGVTGYAFPSPHDPKRPITRNAVTRAMARLREHMGLARITPHDFRRTASTMMTGERIGQPRFIVSRVLNHASDTGGAAKVTEVYDRNAYLAEKRAALNAWADELIRLTMS